MFPSAIQDMPPCRPGRGFYVKLIPLRPYGPSRTWQDTADAHTQTTQRHDTAGRGRRTGRSGRVVARTDRDTGGGDSIHPDHGVVGQFTAALKNATRPYHHQEDGHSPVSSFAQETPRYLSDVPPQAMPTVPGLHHRRIEAYILPTG